MSNFRPKEGGDQMPNQHVVPNGDGWAIKGEGNSKATKITDTKKDAVDAARTIAKNQGSELIIHGKDGKIQSKDSHGKDPFPPKG
ncbi:hypothetical protein D3C75_1303550 [compost metagenome]